jgi:hypothetical protein
MPLISAITSLFSERKIKKNLGNKHSKDLFLWIRENVTDSHIAEQMYLDLIKENPFNLAYLEKNEIIEIGCVLADSELKVIEEFELKKLTEYRENS